MKTAPPPSDKPLAAAGSKSARMIVSAGERGKFAVRRTVSASEFRALSETAHGAIVSFRPVLSRDPSRPLRFVVEIAPEFAHGLAVKRER